MIVQISTYCETNFKQLNAILQYISDDGLSDNLFQKFGATCNSEKTIIIKLKEDLGTTM